MSKHRGDDIRRLVKSVCKPVAMPREFKKRLLERLMRGATKKGGCETKNKGF